MIQTINKFFTGLFDVILYPFAFLPEFWGILFLSVLMSVVVLVIYSYISSPSGILNAKNKIKANILSIRIYRDFWKVILSSFFKSLFYTLKYFTLNFGPVLLIIPILFPAFAQMDVRYGMRGYEVGEDFVIKAAFNVSPGDLSVELLESDAYKPTMNPVFIDAFKDDDQEKPLREVNWKVKALKKGEVPVRFKVNGQVLEKMVYIGNYRGAISNKRMAASSWEHFFYPVEGLLEGSEQVVSVYIDHPGKNSSVLGFEMHWIILNLILVVIIVLALHKRFGIEF